MNVAWVTARKARRSGSTTESKIIPRRGPTRADGDFYTPSLAHDAGAFIPRASSANDGDFHTPSLAHDGDFLTPSSAKRLRRGSNPRRIVRRADGVPSRCATRPRPSYARRGLAIFVSMNHHVLRTAAPCQAAATFAETGCYPLRTR